MSANRSSTSEQRERHSCYNYNIGTPNITSAVAESHPTYKQYSSLLCDCRFTICVKSYNVH